ncbi:MAG TPA: AAA domain-containing protein [Puia sp.]|nr:AAA domain-containing protein [Puia sp.]
MNRILFKEFLLTAFDGGNYTTDDVIAFVLPLFRKIVAFHESGKVGAFEKEEALFLAARHLDMEEDPAMAPAHALYRVSALFPRVTSPNFEVVGNILLRTDAEEGHKDREKLEIHTDWREPLEYPAYLPGYQCFECLLGHHDPQTDIFSLGLVLGSMTLGLNLYDVEDLRLFARVRSNPSLHHPRIHPTLGRLITEMTELDRSRRSQDLYEVIRRLQYYRDYDSEKQTDLSKIAGWIHKEIKERDSYILNKLRNRLFDTSRRNRLLYYKPNTRFVNLTVSSVPMVLHYQSIRPELLFTWNPELADKVSGMKEIVLNKYLRFEDHGYLPSSLDKVRVESQRAVQEYGFSELKLVIAFLQWHNLKEEASERIQSPLLLIPVELRKNKRLKEDHYVVKVLDNSAEVNPVLAGQLKDLYGIRLPDFIDLEEISLSAFCRQLRTQVEDANQGIALNYIDKPRINLIHSEARQTVNNYKKRTGLMTEAGTKPPAEMEQTLETEQVPDIEQALETAQPPETAQSPESAQPLETGQPWETEQPPESAQSPESAQAPETEQLPGTEQAPETKAPPDEMPSTGARPLQKESFELAQSENNPYSWDFDVCNMVLGNFNYKKMSLVRDYNLVIDQQLQHPVFDALFSELPRVHPQHTFDLNRPDDWYHVITADPTQTRAILQSRTGYSYIIQGPPGTGKSQTITNLIADFVARGKSILFVCEKRAALDVVYHRLKQNGLDELCCYIHDSQGDKREFIKDLKATYEDFTSGKMDLGAIRARRTALLEKMGGQLELIREFHLTGTREDKETGMEVRELIERIIALRESLVELPPGEEEQLPSYRDWKDSGAVIAILIDLLEESGAEPVFSEHPFSRIHERIFLADNPYSLLDGLLQQAMYLLHQVETVVRDSQLAAQHGTLDKLKSLVQFAVLLYPLAQAGNLALADPGSEESRELGRRIREYRQQQEQLQVVMQKNSGWRHKLAEQDLISGLTLALKYEGAFFGFLNGPWTKFKKRLLKDYDFSQHVVTPTYHSILLALDAEYEAVRQLSQTKRQLQEQYRLDPIDTAWLSIEILHHKKGDPALTYLLQHPEASKVITILHGLHQPLNQLESRLLQCLHQPPAGELSAIRDELQNIQLNADGLSDWLPALRSFTGLPEEVKNALRQLPLNPIQTEAVIARKALYQIYRANKAFADIDRQRMENAIRQLGEGYAGLRQLNADYIRASIRQRFLQQVDLANMAASQLTEEKKKFKKNYNEGRKILENEFGKSMRHKSIRELSAKESGLVLKDIKPVWLMSPYSVSDCLPLDSDHFDVVIFDEASQITLEEGVPALYRSRQTIIVGDEKQMPPTDFFSTTKAEDPDDLERRDDEDGEEWLPEDADSLLAQGSRKLTSTLLSWHYRSHYETLISFSNHAFYEGRLLTIPDKTIHHKEKTAITITSPDDAIPMADSLFDRSISFHYHTGSVYEKRGNRAEAFYIAHLVRELLNRNTRESIGIVAFSQEQQRTIESALDELAGQDVSFGLKLEEAFNRMENDQFTGLIIKNLENIQGDERDIIIMSVCYGFDARKKMLMNFGPVNKRGGEKRLNVLFSRAKIHMAVVSSIRHHHITNEYNDGANYLRRFLHYAEMVSSGQMEMAGTILNSLNAKEDSIQARPSSSIVLRQIKEQLLHAGYEVAEQIGQSDFKCSLAVKAKPEDESYALGILVDDGKHYQNGNLIEQYYQRPAILQNFGWKVLPVFAKDWLHQPQKVMEQILKLIGSAVPPGPVSGSSRENSIGLAPVTTQEKGTGGQASVYDHLDFQRLTNQEAGSGKFWEAATDGNKLVVRWGKAGSKGQIQLKTFSNVESAIKEKERLIREKTGKGYKS